MPTCPRRLDAASGEERGPRKGWWVGLTLRGVKETRGKGGRDGRECPRALGNT